MQVTSVAAPKSKRLISLDVFRGMTIALMIIVNSPGSWNYVYPPLRHAEWNGMTLTDLVFPFFLFIMGMSITLSLSGKVQSGLSKSAIVPKIIRRTLLLFALGLLLNTIGANFQTFRIPGVLQRIALVYLICSLCILHLNWKKQAVLATVLLVAYWLVMKLVPVPGIGAGILEPGANLAAWIDSKCIPGTLWKGTWDPEGLLGTLPAIATGLSGMLAGEWIRSLHSSEIKIIGLMTGGFVCWTLGSVWNWFFPINKNLWTSSYVLVTSGLAALTHGTLYWLIELRHFQKGIRVAQIFGSNAITAYVIHGILYKLTGFIPGSVTQHFMRLLIRIGFSPELASLSWALFYTGLCLIPVWILYHKKIFIKI